MSRAKHIRRFHQTTVAPAPARTEVCEFCAKTFASSTKLRSHVQKSHSNASSGGQQKVQCDVCAKWMANKVALAVHMKRHESNPQKCPHCAKVSPNDKALDQHIRTVHVQQAKYKCHLCDKAFKVATVLKVSGCRFVRRLSIAGPNNLSQLRQFALGKRLFLPSHRLFSQLFLLLVPNCLHFP